MSPTSDTEVREDDRHFAERILDRALETDNLQLAGLAVRALAGQPPTRELGQMRNAPAVGRTLGSLDLGWAAFVDDQERVPDLRWPHSVLTLEAMATDSQLSGLYRAMTYPIRRYHFMIDPNGARDRIVQDVADDLNLDIVGQEPRPRGRRKGRFSFDEFLYHALLALRYGHMPFEIVGDIIPASRYPGGQRWALRHLYPRMPRTISQINIAEDGGLISIRQNLLKSGLPSFATSPYGFMGPEIPVDQLVWFAWEKEGPNWIGRSIFRDCYRNWLVKDRLIRIDAINHEKAGGIHVATAPQGASPAEISKLSEMAQKAVVSESGGGALPYGAQYDIVKAGSGTDVVASIKYHDEAMSKMFLHMFMQLGTTETGSRALGQTFVEYAYIAQRAVAQWFCDIVSEHVLEDWVDWNWGEEEPAPLLTFVVEEEDEHVAVVDLVALITAGAITIDPELEVYLRDRFMLPQKTIEELTATQDQINNIDTAAGQETAKLAVQERYERLHRLGALKRILGR